MADNINERFNNYRSKIGEPMNMNSPDLNGLKVYRPYSSHVVNDEELNGLREYVPYSPDNEQVMQKYLDCFENCYNNSCNVPTTTAKRKRTAKEKAQINIARALVFFAIFGAGIGFERAHVGDYVETSINRAMDNDEMIKFAAQFYEMFGIKDRITDNHMGYYTDTSEMQKKIDAEIPVMGPNFISAIKVATGSSVEAESVLNDAVAKGKFVGDPDETREMLNDYLLWNKARHDLTVAYKEAGEDLGAFIDNEIKKCNSLSSEIGNKGVK